jgi:K+/H+ antiporter YhaU regulatory subunit KhtT
VRERTGANVVAVERGGVTHPSPGPSFAVQAGDRLLALGGPEAIEALRGLLAERSSPAGPSASAC